MKLKYFIPSLVAVVAAMFTSCSDDKDATYLDGLRVSQSYVALSTSGGSTSIEVTANSSWTITGAPDWLTVSPASGTGSGTVTLSAAAAEGRTAELILTCGDLTQRINVIQGITVVQNATCAEVLAGPEAKTYRVTGVCVDNPDNKYGNWHINDGTGEVYVYGTLDKKGNKGNNPISGTYGWGFEVGDVVTIEGPKTVYNGTVELVDVTVVNIVKSLIKVDSLTVDGVVSSELPVAGGEVTVHLTCKGTGVAVEVPADAKDWLGVTSSTVGTNPTVTFYAKANEGGDREATVTFVTTDGSKEYTSQATITQKGAIVECNVAEFLAAAVGNAQYRVTGVITKVANATYGNVYIKDFSGEAYVYGIGSKGDFDNLGLKVGDIVTLVGKRGEYKGSAQMTGAQYETHIPVTEVTIEEFLQKPDDKNTYYMVTGTISSLLGSNGKANDYGNLYITDGTNELYVYGCYPGWGATGDNRKFFIADNDIQVGDELTMIGYKDTYKGLVELCGGICFGFKHAE
ncbi:MAG: BACON domain-containing protein [Prevotella sp.]|nr:BACON domain-containing protein [Prevotella sp.]